MSSINLGDKVKDTVTGLTGIAVGKTEWLNGCIRYVVQASVDKDGKVPVAESVDAQQLVVVEAKKQAVEPKRTGGPFPEPKRQATPRR